MTKAQQVIWSRMQEIRELVRYGATEMTGRSYRDASGRIAGRHGGGFSTMFPELKKAGMTPAEAARAIESGKGVGYERLVKAIADTYGLVSKGSRRGRATVPPHVGNRKCKHCREAHTTSEHRFHGPGSFHSTHLFAFNPKMKRRKKSLKNSRGRTLIYGKVTRIEAQKTQDHICDEECKRFKHRYFHEFTSGPKMYGLPDGSILITKD